MYVFGSMLIGSEIRIEERDREENEAVMKQWKVNNRKPVVQ